MKKPNKKHQNARCIDEKLKTKSLMFFVSFCKILNLNMRTTKHFGQAAYTELTLNDFLIGSKSLKGFWNVACSVLENIHLGGGRLYCTTFSPIDN